MNYSGSGTEESPRHGSATSPSGPWLGSLQKNGGNPHPMLPIRQGLTKAYSRNASTAIEDDEESNPFLSRPPSMSRRGLSRPTPVIEFIEDESNPFVDNKSAPAPARRQKTAVPQVVEYAGSSRNGGGQEMYSSIQEPLPTTPKRKTYAPISSSLLSPTSSRHQHHLREERARSSHGSQDKAPTGVHSSDELKRARLELKKWEADFKNAHGRAPTLEDIGQDATMIQKYKAYGKLKKAIVAGGAVPKSQSSSSTHHSRKAESSRQEDLLRTPTRPRTRNTTTPTRTPTKRSEVEFVSPRKVISGSGFMSPSKGSKSGQDRHHFLSNIASSTTPTSQRTRHHLLSPTQRPRTKSLLRSPPFNFPSASFVVEGAPAAVGGGMSPILKTPTSGRSSSIYVPNPLQSPGRPIASPLFGGMNNRRQKRLVPPAAPVLEDLEPVEDVGLERGYTLMEYSAAQSAGLKSPLLKTPQKAGAAKVARSLFRRPSIVHSSLSSPLPPGRSAVDSWVQQPSSPGSAAQRLDLGDDILEEREHRKDVHEALDSMSLSDPIEDSDYKGLSLSGGRVVQGFDTDDQPGDETARQSHHVDQSYLSPEVSSEPDDTFYPTREPISPIRNNRAVPAGPPRTPSQQPSLTFSQPTPGSATPDIDILFVPPGFHSHNRRRQVRSNFYTMSQEQEAQFEREFNLNPKQKRQDFESGAVVAANLSEGVADSKELKGVDADGEAWEDQGSDSNDDERHQGTVTAPRKKYTQKRTTRLHRIVVAPSEKAAPVKATRTSSRKTRQTTTVTVVKDTHVDQETGPVADQDEVQASESDSAPSSSSAARKQNKVLPAEESMTSGWANSNKPLVKSDRRIPGIGQGRAGARRPAGNTYGGSGTNSGGNYVAYNLQRGSFRKGGRGKGRFGGSKIGTFVGPAPPTGRTLFDDESWRAEFDKDFDEATLAMSLAAEGDLGLEESDDDMPWYGDVQDLDDPHVITISKKYMKARVGGVNDPEEFIQELERQNSDATKDSFESDLDNGFRVNLLHVLTKVWGYRSFRDGQLESVKRIIRNESVLLVLPTGSGKSLSYQLPAYILSKLGIPSLALVISPMISLMYDQVRCLPPGLTGACWTSMEQTTAQFKAFMDNLTSNAIKVLFISPEKLQSQSFLSLVRSRRIPPISFLCVDEVHCLSEWSHNFRPAYLLLNHILKNDLGSPCVLGLTGTATEGTKDSICSMLEIDRQKGVLAGPVIRENLAMSVSLETDREPALLNLLQSPKFANMDSILIYVNKQAQADALAGFLRVRNFSAESYHAGKSAQDRQRIQQRFMSDGVKKAGGASGVGGVGGSGMGAGSSNPGGIRILCATIAFGLGLNKSNIRSVIHYCMPRSLENYVQETGRSGRDGLRSFCHMFLNQEDYLRLRSMAYADGMDWGTVSKLIRRLFSRRDLIHAEPQPKSSAPSKKRKAPSSKKSVREEDSDLEGSDIEGMIASSSKKRRQNDSRAVGVKSGIKTKKPVDLVMSTSSILVIPSPQPLLPLSSLTMTGQERPSSGRMVVIREELVEAEFDIKKEVLATLLSYIELDESHPIKVIGSIDAKCTVKFLMDKEGISELANTQPLVDHIQQEGVLTGHTNGGGGGGGRSNFNKSSRFGRGGNKSGFSGTTLSMAYCCDSISLCQRAGMAFTELVQELQLWKRKKWIMYEMTDPGLCVEILKEPAQCQAEHERKGRREQMRSISKTNRRRAVMGSMDMEVDDMEDGLDHGIGGMDEEDDLSSVVDDEEDENDPELQETRHDRYVMDLADRLHRKLCAVERVGVAKVDQVYELFQSVATPTWQQHQVFRPKPQAEDSEEEDEDEEIRTEVGLYDSSSSGGSRAFPVTAAEVVLREGIQAYFARTSGEAIGGANAVQDLFSHLDSSSGGLAKMDRTVKLYDYENLIVSNLQRQWRSAVEVDLKVFLSQQFQQQQQQDQGSSSAVARSVDSPRVVARIFHGIWSPCYTALEWGRHKYWAKYVHFDFAQLMQMADRTMRELRQQRLAQLKAQG